MNIVITGGTGFLGLRLARALLDGGVPRPDGTMAPVTKLTLVDRVETMVLSSPLVEQTIGDIADPAFVDTLISPEVDVVYHLAAVVSGEAEANFDLGMRVNVDASRYILEVCRKAGHAPRVVFTSSVAVFGPSGAGDEEPSVDPRSSYGMEKAVAELLLKDYARRGFVDGVVLRLPTISVRPGKPNKAASSFASGIIREPLSGVAADCPVSPETMLWLLSPRRAITNLIHAAGLDTAALATDRIINLPGITVTVEQMLAALARHGGEAARGRIAMRHDEAVERIVSSWPRRWDDTPARALGFTGDIDFDEIVQAFIDDDLPAMTAAA
ncbi:NAD-dependent epimerase/dehydratase family protein [Sphingomonas naphthae]|uniref:NAD-dependent epimerase/dehydratase family protein n=1 Tax=Sphingomonas naphthae TaxID=1813468 RepID=A0ABY7TQN0_9SPHN|nr:D-erythronate dehydrogenase [Sphingomonas naphthae]WCT74154.1 NAD-dependent epimerase/dehydratase family protein [Sphingomonas naphthae]